MKVLGLLILISVFGSYKTLACSGCAKSKGFQTKAAAPTGGAAGLQGARIVGAAAAPKNTGFSEGFFNTVGKDGNEDSAQPIAVPNGDGGDYKVIFK